MKNSNYFTAVADNTESIMLRQKAHEIILDIINYYPERNYVLGDFNQRDNDGLIEIYHIKTNKVFATIERC